MPITTNHPTNQPHESKIHHHQLNMSTIFLENQHEKVTSGSNPWSFVQDAAPGALQKIAKDDSIRYYASSVEVAGLTALVGAL